MSDNIVIKADKISKKFCRSLGHSIRYGFQDIARDLIGLSSNSKELREGEFWAVDDVSFELEKGETLGIIGPNGSGKTTILKMLNGIFMPDKGMIQIKNKVGALIEIGAGFHPLLTARENIYVNGAILGMRKREIDKKFDSIVDFAGIEDFLDSPIKFYSSGMYVRLGFSIAVHCEPDILLVDEILSVGDRNFQIKCFRKLHELKNKEDLSIVLVTHNEYTMREYAQKCIVLDSGKMLFCGGSEDAISFYVNELIEKTISPVEGSIFGRAVIKKVEIKDGNGNQRDRISTGEKIIIDFDYETEKVIKSPIFGITFLKEGREFTGLWNSYANVKLPDISGRGKVRVTVENFDLPVGSYGCYAVLCEEEESNLCEWNNLPQILIVERSNDTYQFLKLKQIWKVIK